MRLPRSVLNLRNVHSVHEVHCVHLIAAGFLTHYNPNHQLLEGRE